VPAPALTPLAAAVLDLDRPPERALVLGSGDGEPVLFLAREFPTARVRGLDRSEQRVREATVRVGLDPEGRVAFKRAGGRKLPYPDRHFDLVVAVDTRPPPREARRVLRAGGRLLLVSTGRGGRLDPGSSWLWRRLRRHGIAPGRREESGNGSFCFGRLDGGDQTPGSD
jgi:ubiquinone/menaquinone biosynthesis C-methylase UbiE